MQSDGNSFYEDVVLDSFGMSCRDEDISDLYYEDINFVKLLKKMHLNHNSTLQ